MDVFGRGTLVDMDDHATDRAAISEPSEGVSVDADTPADQPDELRIALAPPQLAVVMAILAVVVFVIVRRRRGRG